MNDVTRATLHGRAAATGVGVRFGGEVALAIAPADLGGGIVLERADLGLRWPLDLEHSAPGPGCSLSGQGEAAVHFVEHLMAALWARGVTDCLVSVDGREIPLLDGSVRPVLALIDEARVARSAEPMEPIIIEEALLSSDERQAVCALPGEPTSYAYALWFRHPMIGRQFASFQTATDDFDEDLAPARTFITVEEAEQARELGLLAAGSEENAIIIHEDRVSEEPALPAAYARHKIVDMIGDLYLLGRPLVGRVFGFYTGHEQNHALAREIRAWCRGAGRS
ncbi:MAG: UDP-3-O-acyl-N-acetylglucosamine deacetylase [Armatimonadota bacterium]|jgi:UDP-3-O-acyl N-acetylglucosamine deacetylase